MVYRFVFIVVCQHALRVVEGLTAPIVVTVAKPGVLRAQILGHQPFSANSKPLELAICKGDDFGLCRAGRLQWIRVFCPQQIMVPLS